MRQRLTSSALTCLLAALVVPSALADPPAVRTEFRVKYVAEGVVYIDGGRAAGLAEDMKLTVRRPTQPALAGAIAELRIVSVASASVVCEIDSSTGPVQVGDTAVLGTEDAQRIEILRASGGAGRYAQVITFTEGDPLDEEVRELAPHPPLPEVNRVRGRIGFEHNGIHDRGGSGLASSEAGVIFRSDMTRIAGTYWNLSGYTRFRMNRRSGPRIETLNDLLNRTYHLTLYYNNPKSDWTMGFGRFYLPWAASLSTIDGGYVGRRVRKGVTVGMLAGSTPDPASWNYKPNRELTGSFVNFEGGDYESFRYSSTTGIAVTRLSWKPERQFAFFENTFSFKRYFSIYHNLDADKLNNDPNRSGMNGGVAVTRSFVTFRFEPSKFITFDLNHNYFRDFPTFDPRLVGTGLLDKLLFQGVSGGVRLNLPWNAHPYIDLGRSSRTGDARASLNQLYGLMLSNVLGTGFRADARYSRFDSVFGRGAYKAVSLSRDVAENFRFELQAGQQNFSSAFTRQNRARYVNGNIDWFFAAHYFLGGGITVYRGHTQSYDQTYFNMGYRF